MDQQHLVLETIFNGVPSATVSKQESIGHYNIGIYKILLTSYFFCYFVFVYALLSKMHNLTMYGKQGLTWHDNNKSKILIMLPFQQTLHEVHMLHVMTATIISAYQVFTITQEISVCIKLMNNQNFMLKNLKCLFKNYFMWLSRDYLKGSYCLSLGRQLLPFERRSLVAVGGLYSVTTVFLTSMHANFIWIKKRWY
ncbi:hypothetical protein ACJX0J_011558, partial [Zea mays]